MHFLKCWNDWHDDWNDNDDESEMKRECLSLNDLIIRSPIVM